METLQNPTKINWLLVITLNVTVGLFVYFATYLGLTSPAFSWVLNFLLMTWISMLEQLIRPGLKSTYFDAKPFEDGGRIYNFLGINYFRWLLRFIGWEKLSRKANPINTKSDAIRKYERSTRSSEWGHSIIFMIVTAFTIAVWIKSGFTGAVWLIVFNVFLNLYPVMLQRYNRPRIRRLIQNHD